MQNCLRVLGSMKRADKMYYGKCGNGELQFLNPKRKICGFKHIPIRVDGALLLFSMWNSEMASVYKPLVRPENVQTEDMIDITPIHTALLAVHRK